MIYTFDLEVTIRSRDLRSTGDLDLTRSSYTYIDAHQREDLDDSVVFALAQLVPVGTKLAQTPVGAQVNIYIVTVIRQAHYYVCELLHLYPKQASGLYNIELRSALCISKYHD